MLEGMLSLLNDVALIIGYTFLLGIGCIVALVVGRPVISFLAWKDRSDEAKQIGAQMQKEHGYDSGLSALIAEDMLKALEDAGPEPHLEYEPSPVATLDWSVDDPSSTDINTIKSAISDAGYCVHPFPNERQGEWSTSHVGVWKSEPRWYVESDVDGGTQRSRVTPDIDSW